MDEAIASIITALYKHQPLTPERFAEHVPVTSETVKALDTLLDNGWAVVGNDGMIRLTPKAEEPAVALILSSMFAKSADADEEARRAGMLITEDEFCAKAPEDLPFAFMVDRGEELDVWCAGRRFVTLTRDGTVKYP